jgi:hypothetical protein
MEMKISGPTIQALAEMIAGGSDGTKPGYRNGPDLVTFFYSFGSTDIYGSGFPSRKEYTIEKIKEYNGTSTIYEIVKLALPAVDLDKETPEAANKFNSYLKKDGYQIIPIKSEGLISDTGYTAYGNFLEFDIRPIGGKIVATTNVVKLDHEFINDQIRKSSEKLERGDYDGAITNARSLVEAFQEEIIQKSGLEVPKYDGDLQKLYKSTKQALNLDASKDLSDTLKQILTGLNSLVSGISGLSNKMADRHARTYKPSKHHAKLAVNTAFTFCEFLLDSFEYQQAKKNSPTSASTKTTYRETA